MPQSQRPKHPKRVLFSGWLTRHSYAAPVTRHEVPGKSSADCARCVSAMIALCAGRWEEIHALESNQ